MATVIDTSSALTATALGQQPKVAHCQNGVRWTVFWNGQNSTTHAFEFWYSVDGGETWSEDVAGRLGFDGTGTTYTPNSALFIDVDDFAHFVWKDRSTGRINYRRGTPNVDRTGWTWSAVENISAAQEVFVDHPSVVAFPNGDGWVAHVVQSRREQRPTWTRIDISEAGAFTVTQTHLGSGSYSGSSDHTFPSIDFRHNGDGKTADAAPDLFIAWSSGTTSDGLRFMKLPYAAGSWTLGTERALASSRWVRPASGNWLTCLFDGVTPVVAGNFYTGSANYLGIYERDLADTTTTTRFNFANANRPNGSAAYDQRRNIYLISRGASSATPQVVCRKWDRAAGTSSEESLWLGDWPAAKREPSGGVVDLVSTAASGPPYEVTYGVAANLNRPPHAPTITNPTPGQAWARNEPNRVGIQFNDPDPGDSQSGNGGAVRLAGETEPYYMWDGETPNEWHDIPADELLAGDNELHAWSYDSQGEVGPPSDWVPFVVGDRPGPPTIVDPINGATIPTQTYPVVISASTLEAARYRRYADVGGVRDPETVYQDELVEQATSRQKTLNFPVNQRWEWIGVIRKRDGLWSNDEALHRVWVSWTAPAEPTVTVAIHEDLVDGRMMPVGFAVTASHPTPDEELEEPAVTHMDVWRAIDDGTGQPVPGSEEQLQRGTALAPAATFIDPSVRSGVPYLYRVRAWGTNGVYTDAPWAG